MTDMSAKLKYLMPLLSIFAVAACEEEQSGTSVENTVLDVVSAVYDDAAGAYSVELGKDGTTVSFVLSSQREGLIYSSPVPATGTYRTDATEEDRVLEAGASWTSEDGMEFVADEAWVSAVSDGTGCRLNGTFSDAEGMKTSFDTLEETRIYGPLVKRLRHRPFTAVAWVRLPYGSPENNERSVDDDETRIH